MPLLSAVRKGLSAAISGESHELANPASIHRAGQAAKRVTYECKKLLSELLGTRDSDEWIFNSGATEGINNILKIFEGKTIAYSAVDHSAVVETLELQKNTTHVKLPVDANGKLVEADCLEKLSRCEGDILLCWQVANNETGVVFDLAILEKIVKTFHTQQNSDSKTQSVFNKNSKDKPKQRLFVLLDAAQAFAKLPDSFLRRAFHYADYCVISAHKVGAPMGIGALWIRSGVPFNAIISGGAQEKRRRAGTANAMGILGLKLALSEWKQNGDLFRAQMQELKNRLQEKLSQVSGIFFHGYSELTNTINFHVEGCLDESLVLALDLEGFFLSSGSACNSGSLKPSRVLKAMGYSDEIAVSSVRVCVGPETTLAEIDLFVERFQHRIEHIRASRLNCEGLLPEMQSSINSSSKVSAS